MEEWIVQNEMDGKGQMKGFQWSQPRAIKRML